MSSFLKKPEMKKQEEPKSFKKVALSFLIKIKKKKLERFMISGSMVSVNFCVLFQMLDEYDFGENPAV